MTENYRHEAYVLALIHIVLPGRAFETTTAPVGLSGNSIYGLRTLDVYALLAASPEQQAAAWAAVDAAEARAQEWREQRPKQVREYPY